MQNLRINWIESSSSICYGLCRITVLIPTSATSLHPSPHYQKSLLCCGSLCHLQKLYLTFSACHAVKARRAIKACVHNLADELSSYLKVEVRKMLGNWEDALLVLWSREWQLSSVAVLAKTAECWSGFSGQFSVWHVIEKANVYELCPKRCVCAYVCVCVGRTHKQDSFWRQFNAFEIEKYPCKRFNKFSFYGKFQIKFR